MLTAGVHLDLVNMDIHVLGLVRTSLVSWHISSDLLNDVDNINFNFIVLNFS